MAQPSKEPCKKEACDIQACLSKNMFHSRKCVRVIQLLQSCCEQCEYKSTHCGSLSGLLKNISKFFTVSLGVPGGINLSWIKDDSEGHQ
ncbi:hypothetical protein PVAP13_3KG055200 [Panicum virgatum]|uniref:Cx9C motif-containing protein 4 n=2 Tax=Panicum virgatum TaxID=38727 RepID=A0A8T0UM08_PANVG|nr:hypothetical protein PVAP13_3KG055200 [Panicum virgatum]